MNVKGGDSRETALIVNAVADELIKSVRTLERPATSTASPIRGPSSSAGSNRRRRSHPGPPTTPGSGCCSGCCSGSSAASPGSRPRTGRGAHCPDLGEELGVRVLGALTDSPQLRLLTTSHEIPTQRGLDDFRRIRINLLPRLQQAAGSGGSGGSTGSTGSGGSGRSAGSTVLLTSATGGEGKTTLATGLAAAFAEDVRG